MKKPDASEQLSQLTDMVIAHISGYLLPLVVGVLVIAVTMLITRKTTKIHGGIVRVIGGLAILGWFVSYSMIYWKH